MADEENFSADELNRASSDGGILLGFLGRADDGRLQFYFADLKSELAGTLPKHALPPSRSYATFLSRLRQIRDSIANKEKISSSIPVPQQQQPNTDPLISDAAFLNMGEGYSCHHRSTGN
jgi:hypothetical protein